MSKNQPDLFLNGPVSIMMAHKGEFTEEFRDWLPENLHIWYAFDKEARRIVKIGRSHYSARTIVEFLRHHSTLREASGTWKINDHAVPYLARLWGLMHPDSAYLFEKRVARKAVLESAGATA